MYSVTLYYRQVSEMCVLFTSTAELFFNWNCCIHRSVGGIRERRLRNNKMQDRLEQKKTQDDHLKCVLYHHHSNADYSLYL